MYFFSEREKFIKTESKSLMVRKNDPVGIQTQDLQNFF